MHSMHLMTVLILMLLLVVIPAMIGFCLYTEFTGAHFHPTAFDDLRQKLGHFFHSQFEPGDFLIYRKAKVSPRPGPRARNVHASEKGDDYYYEVDKFWTVVDVLDDGRLVARTRTGKEVRLTAEDERLRRAGMLERLRFRRRFPSL